MKINLRQSVPAADVVVTNEDSGKTWRVSRGTYRWIVFDHNDHRVNSYKDESRGGSFEAREAAINFAKTGMVLAL